jgi:tRNA nucleotidyltransferase/poly(A) polymerase
MGGEKQDPYAGRWIASIRGRLVAHGGTPEQALRLAQSRYKETPEIRYIPMTPALEVPSLVNTIHAALPQGMKLYLVGGAVRDLLLGRPTHDFDFALQEDGIRVARAVADALGAAIYPLDAERGTGRVLYTAPDGARHVIDFAAYRGADLETDLRGRDFTINAIALDPADGSLHDPLGGVHDLRAKCLRQCSPTAFTDDPLRILRGVRLAAALDFHIQPETRQAMKQAADRLGRISGERLRDELFRILEGPKPAACLRALEILRALDDILPELSGLKGLAQPAPHVHDGWQHTLSVLNHLEAGLSALAPVYAPETADDLLAGMLVLRLGRYREQIAAHLQSMPTPGRSRRGLLFLAALYHDAAKADTAAADEGGRLRFWEHDQKGADLAVARARQLALSNEEGRVLDTIVRNHMRIHFHTNRLETEGKPPTRRAIYRFFRDSGDCGVDLVLLALADLRATYEQELPQAQWAACLDVCRTLLEAWWEKRPEQVDPPTLLDGNDLMHALGLPPGPRVGKLLEALREAQATGDVVDREQALAFVAEKNQAEQDPP